MSVPITSQLTYAWRRLRKKDAIYSNTFEYSGQDMPQHTAWAEAVPVKGQPDSFNVTIHTFRTVSWVDNANPHLKYPTPDGPFTREDALGVIQNWENEMLKPVNGYTLRELPHFGAFIETTIVNNGVNPPFSAITGNKAAVKAHVNDGIAAFEEYLQPRPPSGNSPAI